MLNFGQSFATFLGIALAVAGVGLYFLRSVRPELA
ncbi:MAG: Ycf66 family protein, partial [Phormidium sp.]